MTGLREQPAIDHGEAPAAGPVRKEPAPDRYAIQFDTNHLLTNLKHRSIHGGVVTLVAQATKFGLQLTGMIVLARLLTPADFGLIAMVTAITGFVAMFADGGLSAATVQRDTITHGQVSTLFWVNVGLGTSLTAVVAALAPMIAWFYSEPKLTHVTLAIAGTLILSGLTVQHVALLRRQMRFVALAVIEVASLGAGVGMAIALAWNGAEYWALVAMPITSVAATMVLAWSFCRWMPGLPRRGTGVRPMLSFGGNLTAASFLHYIGSTADKVLIGRTLGPALLGLYGRAFQLVMLPISQLNAPIGAVAMPALCRCIDEPERYRRGYISLVQRIGLITAPAVAFAIACSDWLVLILLGPQWGEAAIIFSILAVAGFYLPIRNSTGWLFVSQNRMREHLVFHAVDSPLKILAAGIGLAWGGIGVAAALAIQFYITAPFLFWIIGRKGPVRTIDFYRLLRLPIFVACVNLVALLLIRTFLLGSKPVEIGLITCALVAFSATIGILLSHTAGRVVIRGTIQDVKSFTTRPC